MQTKVQRQVQFGTLVLAWLLTSCSDVRLAPAPGPGNASAVSKGSFCVSPPTEVKTYTKILFIVDKSYSNQLVYLPDGGTLPGTDPGAVKRGGAIDRFVTANQAKDWYRYGLVAFLEDYGQSYIKDPKTGAQGFTPNVSDVLQATQDLRSNSDAGETPYIEALQTALQVIKNDMTDHRDERSSYYVLFFSDGIPTVGQKDSKIFGLVQEIKNQGANVVFNSGYYGNYGNYTDEAKNRLREMARIGGGKFIDFNQTSNWDFEDFFDKPTYEPWFLSHFLVYNVSAGYCLDGKVDVDSDADGMCDRDELRFKDLGFDPQKRFSFGDGYGDYFHWRRFKYRETLPPCTDRSDDDHDLLTVCEEKYIKNDDAPAEIGKSGNPQLFDTDRDGVLDGIETFVYFTRTLAFAMDAKNLTDNFDGEEPADFQISQHRNPLLVDSTAAVSYDSRLEPLDHETLDCYAHDQRKLPLYPTLAVKEEDTLPGYGHARQENTVLVYYVQKPQKTPDVDGVLRFSVQKLKNDSIFNDANKAAALLKISDSVFSTYSPPPPAGAP